MLRSATPESRPTGGTDSYSQNEGPHRARKADSIDRDGPLACYRGPCTAAIPAAPCGDPGGGGALRPGDPITTTVSSLVLLGPMRARRDGGRVRDRRGGRDRYQDQHMEHPCGHGADTYGSKVALIVIAYCPGVLSSVALSALVHICMSGCDVRRLAMSRRREQPTSNHIVSAEQPRILDQP